MSSNGEKLFWVKFRGERHQMPLAYLGDYEMGQSYCRPYFESSPRASAGSSIPLLTPTGLGAIQHL